MTFVREFDESSKLAAGLRYTKREWEMYFVNLPDEDFIIGYLEVMPNKSAMVIDDKSYLVVSINDDDYVIVAGLDGYIDIPKRYLFKMMNGEIFDIETRTFVKKNVVNEKVITRIREVETIEDFNNIKDDVINSLTQYLQWDSDGGSPGVDIRAKPNSFMTYVVRHLSKGKFDVILNLEDTQSIYFQEHHTSYDSAKAFAQQDFEKRTTFI